MTKKEYFVLAFTILRRTIGYGLLVTATSFVAIAVFVLNDRPDLSVWHKVDLDEEFTNRSKVKDFAAYLELEGRLFEQLEKNVYAKTEAGDGKTFNRFRKGSVMDPTSRETNWNRSFEWKNDAPSSGVLLLHGLSDSPYSLRNLGESCHEAGAHVIGLRIPGHGTAPSGLVETTWKDMAAAVRLTARHLKKEIGDKPLYVFGYSNGGALAVIHAIESLEESDVARPDALVLLSPEIAVSKAAGLAVWQGRMGHWLGLEKLAWNSIAVEYDPYKYNSFAVNAGDQAYRITAEMDKRLARLESSGKLADFPRVLAFQSAVDATVSAPALVSRLFDRLPGKGNELVLFDINRVEEIGQFLKDDPEDFFKDLLTSKKPSFDVKIVTNQSKEGIPVRDVIVKHRKAGEEEFSTPELGLSWPRETFSLSHVALPFSETDANYGSGDGGKIPTLGNLAFRGERGTLLVGPGEMLRQKWNPFYPYVERESLKFLNLDGAEAVGP